MKKNIIAIVLLLFTMSTASAGASGSPDPGYLAQVVMNDSILLFADHYDDASSGNWIQLSGGDQVLLPDPLSFSYRGVNHSGFHSESLDLTLRLNLAMSGEGDYYKEIVYPYTTHPVYSNAAGKNEVSMDFKGDPRFAEQGVRVYLVKADLASVFDMFADVRAANTDDFEDLVHRNIEESDIERFPKTLDANGDLLTLDLGARETGDYVIVVLLDSPDELVILSATAFKVLPYGMTVDTSITEKSTSSYTLDVNVDLDGPDTSYNYTAVLIEASKYKAELEMESDGARTGTNLSINGREVMEDFDLPAKLSSETDLLDFIGIDTEDVSNLNSFAADVFGENTQFLKKDGNGNSTSFNFYLDNVNVPKDYILFTGVWKSGEGLVSFNQKKITVDKKDDEVKPPSGGGGGKSSGGGGGGGGGSPEPANNVQVKELAQQFITNGNRIRFEFIRKATTVDYVEFDAKRSFGKTTTIIEELKGISVLTPADPEGEIYKHINIWVGNGGFSNTQNIASPAVGFRVSKAWIAENEIIESTITLHRYSENIWNALQTRKIGEDEEFVYFEASSPGFSPFVITAENSKLVIEEIEEEAQPPTGTEQPAETKTPEIKESPGEKEKTGVSKSIMSKAFSFIIGFMLVILIGMAVIEKKKQ